MGEAEAGSRREGGRIRAVVHGDWWELVLDHPRARNAMSLEMMADLEQHIETMLGAPPVAVKLRGAGSSAFCAGGDLRAVRGHLVAPGAGEEMCRRMGGLMDRLRASPTLVVAAIEGVALGGGAELVAACDHVIACEGARIGFVHSAMGVSPGWGGGRALVGRVGPRRARVILLGGRVLGAREAHDLGLFDEICPVGSARELATAWISELTRASIDARRAASRIASGCSSEEETALFASLWGGPAHTAALARSGKGRR